MKKDKKLILSLAAALALIPTGAITINANKAYAVQTDDQTTKRTLTLNHNTRIYNKKGQKLSSYQRSNGLLKKGKTVKYAAKAQAIIDPSTQRYSFHDDEWNWFYLPYKTIKGKEYYSIGNGGYIKAANVDSVDNNELFINQVTATVKDKFKGKLTVLNNDERAINSDIKIGNKFIINREIDPSDLLTRSDGDTSLYGIKSNTDSYIPSYEVKIKRRHPLLPYSNCMKLLITNPTNYYTEDGTVFTREVDPSKEAIIGDASKEKFTTTPALAKGNQIAADKEVYIYVPEDQKKEKFYEVYNNAKTLNDNTTLFVKVADTKYIYGLQIKNIDSKN
ncbi:SLAP domain-containing protein [Lactobacillus sp. ESL0791]|uniref:SLAP domain-containing protein n=1 Tax=Lactobacillus sp. ESL0791 TaxID=2983234 RepID=UPI0023F74F66|nr:SLAP domain-containing protein [Lactobacillus sp. ESL0791]MDF7638069.1 SLAP domain-containing protein [Lactobacillus sp. ESL0791]